MWLSYVNSNRSCSHLNNPAEVVSDSILHTIGATPLVRLDRLVKACNVNGTILAKLEYLNPGGSKKDRVAAEMISIAERNGVLTPGQTVVEATSGNMGTALAIVCSIWGYPFVAVMSEGNSIERRQMMEAFGAEVVLVEQGGREKSGMVSGDDFALVRLKAKRIAKERNAYWADQFSDAGSLAANQLLGKEVISQTKGKFDAFADILGSGGTFAGVSKAIKKFNPKIKCVAVEPQEANVLSNQKSSILPHPIQGVGYSISDLNFLKKCEFDSSLLVSGQEAKITAQKLARLEGIFAGYSSGANVAAALKLLNGKFSGKTIVVIICDSGLKYLSTDLWKP